MLGPGIINKFFEDFPVPNMNSVKSANGNDRRVFFVVFGDALDCYHVK